MKSHSENLKLKRVVYVNYESVISILWVAVLLVFWWPSKTGFFSYFDEIITIISTFFVLKKLFVNKISTEYFVILASLILLLFFGFIGSVFAKLGQPIIAIILDAFSLLKYPMVYLYFKYCVSDEIKKTIIHLLIPICKIYVLIAFICGILNLVYNFGMSYDLRYGIRSFKFIYTNPGSLTAIMFAIYALFSTTPKSIGRTFYNFMVFANIIFTLRGTAISVLGVLILSKLLIKDKIRIKHICIFAVIAVALSYSQIQEYFFGESIRSILVQGGLEVCQMYKPFGAGFASYASAMAYEYYSPLYYVLGFDKIWGLNLVEGGVINDTFWPMVLAQFGLHGCVLYLLMIGAQFFALIKTKLNKDVLCASFAILVFLLISSTNIAIYKNETSIHMIIVFCLCLSYKEKTNPQS